MKEKRCPKCGEVKSVSEFHKNKTRKDGLANYCKECRNTVSRAYEKTDKSKARKKAYKETDKYKSYVKEYQKSDKYKEYQKSDKYKEYNKAYNKRRRAVLNYGYVENLISLQLNIKEVPQTLVYLKMSELRLFRAIKGVRS